MVNRNFYNFATTEFPNMSGGIEITSMCSLDYYGIFLGADSGYYIASLVPVINTQETLNVFSPVTDADGLVEFSSIDYVERDVSSYDASAANYRLL